MRGADVIAKVTRVWYIFIDVVEFTGQGRSMSDMVFIITTLNRIVSELLLKHNIAKRQVIILATGDGMCLGLMKSSAYIQIQFAFDLRQEVENACRDIEPTHLRFLLRTSMNIYDDYLIKDINNKQNLIGHGINTAARILGLCEPGEIVVSSHMYSGMEKDGQYMNAFSQENQETIKGERYTYRRIELAEVDRTWNNTVPNVSRSDSHSSVGLSSSEEGKKPKAEWPEPKELISEPFDESLINDSKLRHLAEGNKSWHPSITEPQPSMLLGSPSYPREFRLKRPFRSFSALVSPNGDSFKLVMKLMNEHGILPVHMAYGEVSFTLRSESGTKGMVLGFLEANEWHERTLPADARPRFEVKLEVLPVRTSKLLAARLHINDKLVQTKMIPKEFTVRFGVVASGNGRPCHMSLSEMWVYTAVK
jgi:class 3 adenylate cyclase